MNTVPSFNKYLRRFHALGYALRYPSLFKKTLRIATTSMIKEGSLKSGKVVQKALEDLFDTSRPIQLANFISHDGNVSYFELIAIATIIANRAPLQLLEIGTFDGNTTLQMALNAPAQARIHTLDLEAVLKPHFEDLEIFSASFNLAASAISSSRY